MSEKVSRIIEFFATFEDLLSLQQKSLLLVKNKISVDMTPQELQIAQTEIENLILSSTYAKIAVSEILSGLCSKNN